MASHSYPGLVQMVPLRDENPTKIPPYLTYSLIVLNSAIFLYQLTLPADERLAFIQAWAIIPKHLTTVLSGAAFSFQPLLTLVTSQFLHAGPLHLGGNMLFLWIFGNNIEERLGRLKFLLFYLACGALAGLTQWLFSPAFSTTPSLGASGAIAGVMGAYILRYPRAIVQTLIPLGLLIPILIPLGFFFRFNPFPVVPIPAFYFLGIWFLEQAISGFEVPMGAEGGIAYWAHAGGFVIGLVLDVLFDRGKKESDSPA